MRTRALDSVAVDTPMLDLPSVDMAYALAYDRTDQRLHFGSDHLDDLTFTATVFDQSGRLVMQFAANSPVSVAHLPRGLYVVTWQWQGRRHSAKFMR